VRTAGKETEELLRIIFDKHNGELESLLKSGITITDDAGRVLVLQPQFYFTADLKTFVQVAHLAQLLTLTFDCRIGIALGIGRAISLGGKGRGDKCPYCNCGELERANESKLDGWKLFSKDSGAFNRLLSEAAVPIQNVVICTMHSRLRNADFLLRTLVQRWTSESKKADKAYIADFFKGIAKKHNLDFSVRNPLRRVNAGR
jgi:hypothetical protein